MFDAKFVKYLEDMANRKLLAEEFNENLMTVNGGVEYYFKDKITAHDRGMQDGITMLARTIIGLSAVAVAGSATAANMPSSDASGFVDGALDSAQSVSSNVVQNTALHATEKTVECIGVCESKEVFVSEVPDSGILDSVGDVIGSAVGMVGDGVGGALSAVGEVVGDVLSSL